MSDPPAIPKICHITHMNNLSAIVQAGSLWSDAKRIELGLDTRLVGMSKIKRRRLEEIEVSCHPGAMVGQFVPFYFCPRSIMLYILHRGNHQDIDYREGQTPIVHLVADLNKTIRWAAENNREWAVSPTNAGARYADFFNTVGDLVRIDWDAVRNRDFRSPPVKEAKQAEFLMRDSFPWSLVEQIGVFDQTRLRAAQQILSGTEHQPPIRVENGWYY